MKALALVVSRRIAAICGRVSPWGATCPLPAGHHEAHDWRFRR